MKTIQRINITKDGEQVIDIPQGAKIVNVGGNGTGQLFIWAEVDTDQPMRKLAIHIRMDGHELPSEPCKYVGTMIMFNGEMILHIYYGLQYEDEVAPVIPKAPTTPPSVVRPTTPMAPRAPIKAPLTKVVQPPAKK